MCGKRKLIAKPDKVASSATGGIDLTYSNPSIGSLKLRVARLYSRNNNVASATCGVTPPMDIQVSGRNPKSLIPIPFRASMSIGSWSAINLGYASLVAEILVFDEFDQLLYSETPSDDVQVI